jgi:hypothetical protein
MRKRLLILPLAVLSLAASAQLSSGSQVGARSDYFKYDRNARIAYNNMNEIATEGSPFLLDEYVPMEITLDKGEVFRGIKVKLNVVDNEVLFLNDDGVEMASASPIKRLKYSRPKADGSGTEEVIIESFGSPINQKSAIIYEVLVDGKAKLLKQIEISFSDVRKYPEGTMARVFKKKTYYCSSVDGQWPKKLEKTKADVLAVFPDKQAEMKNFVDMAKLKCKTEEDLVAVFSYYAKL